MEFFIFVIYFEKNDSKIAHFQLIDQNLTSTHYVLTKIIGCKTIRYKNSFAYSSRNYLLSKSELLKLKLISKIMLNFSDLLKKNFKNKKKINLI